MSRVVARSAWIALAIIANSGCSSKPAPPNARVLVASLQLAHAEAGVPLYATVPDARDSVSNQNPPGTVEVFSGGDDPVLKLDPTAANTCGEPALHVDVLVKSYATEALANVIVNFQDMQPTDHRVCNQSATVPPWVNVGQIGYGALAGSPVADGTQPGGVATRRWWISFPNSEPFSFRANVWADITPSPPSDPQPATAGALLCPSGSTCGSSFASALQWTGSTPDGFIVIATDPAFAATVEAAVVAGTGGPDTYAFSYTPASTEPGLRYWRAVNRFTQPGGAGPVNGTFSVGGSYAIDAAPTSFAAVHVPFYDYAVSADSAAPLVDFYSWNWSAPGYYYFTESSPYRFGTPQQSGTTFTAQAPEPFSALDGQPIGTTPVHLRACTQYGTAFNAATQGACAYADYTVP